jgi:hypothetical protein
VEGLLTDLRAGGYRLISSRIIPSNTAGGIAFILRDPDGHAIQVVQQPARQLLGGAR